MAELSKIARVAGREIPGAPHEVLLVVDATTGQNGLSQAQEFTKAAGVTGVVLTKLDGTAKGGVALAIHRELGLPAALRRRGRGGGRPARLRSRRVRGRPLVRAGPPRPRDERRAGGTWTGRSRLHGASAGPRARWARARRAPTRAWAACSCAAGAWWAAGIHRAAGSRTPRRSPWRRPAARARGDGVREPRALRAPRTHPALRGPAGGQRRRARRGLDRRPRTRASNGRGFARLARPEYASTSVCSRDGSRAQRTRSSACTERGRPLVTLKAALSLDGMLAAAGGARTLDHRSRGAPLRPPPAAAPRRRARRGARPCGATIRGSTVRLPGVSAPRGAGRARAGARPAAHGPPVRAHGGRSAACASTRGAAPARAATARLAAARRHRRARRRDGGLDLARDAGRPGRARRAVGARRGRRAHVRPRSSTPDLADRAALFVARACSAARGGTPLVERATAADPAAGWRLERCSRSALGPDLLLLGRLRRDASAGSPRRAPSGMPASLIRHLVSCRLFLARGTAPRCSPGSSRAMGRVAERAPAAGRAAPGRDLRPAPRRAAPSGESIAVDGVCLTVAAARGAGSRPTSWRRRWPARRSTASRPGRPVNLERSLRVGDRLGGHWVAGHVDGTVRVSRRRAPGGGLARAPRCCPPPCAALRGRQGLGRALRRVADRRRRRPALVRGRARPGDPGAHHARRRWRRRSA